MKEDVNGIFSNRTHLLLALLVLIIITFAPVMSAEYIHFDEHVLILENKNVLAPLSLDSLVTIFTSFELNIYTPLSVASHWLEYNLFGFNSAISHFINLLLHIVTAVLVFQFVAALVSDLRVAFVISAMWAVHPIQVESVAWVFERRNLLYGLFYFASIVAYLKYQKSCRGADMAAATIFMAISSLSKGLACLLPLIWLMLDWVNKRPISRASFKEKLPGFIIAVVFLFVMFSGMQSGLSKAERPGLNYLIASYNIAFYVAKTILPLNLNPMYEVNTGSHGKFVYVPIFLLITLVAAFIICRKSRLAIFAVFFYLVHIIPLSNIVQVGYSFSAVLHFLYVALLGILLCLVMSYRDVLSSLNKTNLFMPVSFVLIIILSILSFQYTQVWGQSRTLLEYAIELDPENRFARTLIGLYHRQQGNFQEAEKHYKELVRLYPDYEGGYYGLGLVYRSYGRHAEAIEYFSKALEHTQKRADLPLDRGILLMTRGDFAKAEKDFSLSLQNRYPNLALAYFWRSVARRRQGNYAGAIDDLLKAAADNQEDFSLKICLLELFLESGQITDAGLALISVCQQAFRNPQQWPEHLRIISEPSFAAFIQRLAPYRNYFRYQFNWYPF